MGKDYSKKNEKAGWIVLSTIVVFLLGMIVIGFFFKSDEKIKVAIKDGKVLSFLVLGIDDDKNIKGGMVLFYNAQTKKIGTVSLLPKTYLSFGSQKGYYTLEESIKKGVSFKDIKDGVSKLILGNPEIAKDKLPQLIDAKINYFFAFSKKNVIRLVDLVDGVELFSKELRIPEQDIYLNEGLHLYDGDNSAFYMGFTKSDNISGEYDQLNRIIKFTVGFLKLKSNFLDLVKNKFIKSYFYKTISRTDMKIEEFLILLNEVKKNYKVFKKYDYSLGFENRIVYSDVKKSPGYDYICQPKNYGKFIRKGVLELVTNISKQKENSDGSNEIVLEILNGTNRNNLARKAQRHINSFGYDVFQIGNANSDDYEKTIVIWHKHEKKGIKIADLMHCTNILQGSYGANDIDGDIDVTVILGKDFDGRVVK